MFLDYKKSEHPKYAIEAYNLIANTWGGSGNDTIIYILFLSLSSSTLHPPSLAWPDRIRQGVHKQIMQKSSVQGRFEEEASCQIGCVNSH